MILTSGENNKFAGRDIKNTKKDLKDAFIEGIQKNHTYINKTVPQIIETYGYANQII